jgi:hypothetical protein
MSIYDGYEELPTGDAGELGHGMVSTAAALHATG